MGIARVAVIEAQGEKDKPKQFLVRPSVVFLADGDVFRVLNQTEYNVTITPQQNPHAFLNLCTKAASHAVCPHGVFELVARGKGANAGCRYGVHLDVGGKSIQAKGDSDPAIIIDNP